MKKKIKIPKGFEVSKVIDHSKSDKPRITINLKKEPSKAEMEANKLGFFIGGDIYDKYDQTYYGKIKSFKHDGFWGELQLGLTESNPTFIFADRLTKEKPKQKDNKCNKCGNEVGNRVFTVCDNCWNV